MDFDAYNLDPSIYDEMFLSDGSPRAHCRALYDTLSRLSAEELASIQERVTRSFEDEGITFTVYGDQESEERIIPIYCLPRVMSGAEWRGLDAGLTQRIAALNLFLEDVYGGSRSKDLNGQPRIIHDGVIPADMVYEYPQYRTEMLDFSPPHGTWVAICGTDLVRTNDGFHVLEDNLQDLVVKRVGESGGYGMLIGPHATSEERDEYARQVRANPADFISQPTLALSRAPCLITASSSRDMWTCAPSFCMDARRASCRARSAVSRSAAEASS